jgi:sugar diacid utilization regulator
VASGDAQRAWFPEMLENLKETWNKNMTWKQISILCGEMQSIRNRIRKERNIKPIRFFCKKCGKYQVTPPLPITIRSLLFALKKIKKITEEEFKELDKDWKKYRKTKNLDIYGKEKNLTNDKDIN